MNLLQKLKKKELKSHFAPLVINISTPFIKHGKLHDTIAIVSVNPLNFYYNIKISYYNIISLELLHSEYMSNLKALEELKSHTYVLERSTKTHTNINTPARIASLYQSHLHNAFIKSYINELAVKDNKSFNEMVDTIADESTNCILQDPDLDIGYVRNIYKHSGNISAEVNDSIKSYRYYILNKINIRNWAQMFRNNKGRIVHHNDRITVIVNDKFCDSKGMGVKDITSFFSTRVNTKNKPYPFNYNHEGTYDYWNSVINRKQSINVKYHIAGLSDDIYTSAQSRMTSEIRMPLYKDSTSYEVLFSLATEDDGNTFGGIATELSVMHIDSWNFDTSASSSDAVHPYLVEPFIDKDKEYIDNYISSCKAEMKKNNVDNTLLYTLLDNADTIEEQGLLFAGKASIADYMLNKSIRYLLHKNNALIEQDQIITP